MEELSYLEETIEEDLDRKWRIEEASDLVEERMEVDCW